MSTDYDRQKLKQATFCSNYGNQNTTNLKDTTQTMSKYINTQVAKTLDSAARRMYLDYVNNFMSTVAFAEHHGLGVHATTQIIELGRELHEIHVAELRAEDNENDEVTNND